MSTKDLNRDAHKELGLGCPPEDYGTNADMALADFCSPQSRLEIGEAARWIIDLPVEDADIPTTFGNRWNIWGTRDENPPPGVAEATNTVATPNMFPGDFIVRGFQVRILVPPEGRTIPGALYTPPAGSNALPGIPDVWTQNDFTNGALALPSGAAEPIPALLLSGTAAWKVAYPLLNAMELRVGQNHQDSIIKQPLTACATVQPFTEADAAGNVYGSNMDDTNAFNQRMIALGFGEQFLPPNFKRLGSVTATGPVNVGIFTPSRDEDAQPTMWGGPGVPLAPFQKSPFVLDTPLFWPAGNSMSIELVVSSNYYLAQAQRWLSATGGTGGNAGNDLNLQPSQLIAQEAGYTGFTPSTPGATGMLEQTLDASPANVSQQVQAGRAILKFGRMVVEIVVYGWRVTNPAWAPVVARAIHKGAIAAPCGHGNLNVFMSKLKSGSMST